MPVVVLTAPAHRAGKRVMEHLVDDGWDMGFWGLAAMRTRATWVTAQGRRVANVRGNILDPVSVRFMVAETARTFDRIDAVVHVAADHLAIAEDGSDPATTALVDLGAVRVVYVAEPTVRLDAALAWCTTRRVEAVVIDSGDKVHAIAPAVRDALGR